MSLFPPETLSFRQNFVLPDAHATRALGTQFAALLQPGDIVALSGALGGGKTTFSQGIAAGLRIENAVSSPTFVFMNEYESPRAPLLHLDAYRAEGFGWDELRDAGFEEFLERTDAIRVVEWPEMVAQWLTAPHFWLRFEIEDDSRRVEIAARRDFTGDLQ